MQPRCSRDAGEMQGRCRGDAGEMQPAVRGVVPVELEQAAEREAARVEAQLAAKKKSYEESQTRARRIQEAQERIAKAQQELAELERQENGG